MKLSSQQIARVHQLRSEGYTIREIHDEMGIPRLYVTEALKQPVTLVVPTQPVASIFPYSSYPDQQALLTERARVSEEAHRIADWKEQMMRNTTPFGITSPEQVRELEELTRQTAALSAARVDLERRETELKNQLQAMPNKEEQYEEFRRRARQEKLTKRYNRLIQHLLDNCDDIRWTGDEVDDFLQLAESIKTSVQQYCDSNAIDERRLLIFNGLTFITDEVSEMQDDQTSGFFSSSSVDFDFGPVYQAKLKSYMVDSFEQETPADLTVAKSNVTKTQNDEDEDDDFDEE